MPQVKMGRNDEPAIDLVKSDDLIAVRTRSTRSVRSGPVASPAAAEVQDGSLVLAFPEAGVEVFRVPTGTNVKSVAERKRALERAPDVRFAGGVMVDRSSGEPVVYTENLFVKFKDEVDPDDCRDTIRDAGLTIKREVTYATNAFFVSAPEGTGERIFEIAQELLDRPDVEYCHPELVRRRESRAIPAEQWHLKSTVLNGSQVAASANVEAAHAHTLGEGVVIAIIDDGVDVDHPEFGTPGKIVAPRDATLKTDDPRPKDFFPDSPDNHGTACAGVACADGRFHASGVAPKARLMPIRLSSGLGSQDEADAFHWAADHGADVISCSWGPADGRWWDPNDPRHNRFVPIPASTRLAIDYATTTGRGGKGCLVLFAAGNGNESVDNDGYASYAGVVAVAACNDRGKRSVYSDFGQAVFCSFPSSDFGFDSIGHPEPLTTGIWTTDRSGASGYNPGRPQLGDAEGDYTNDFGGTSSACPGAAGVAALVISSNPDLRWQEVRGVLGRSCDRIDPQGGAYDARGHSSSYGFGRLNAATAVSLASRTEQSVTRIVRTFNLPLPDLQTVRATLDVGETDPIETLSVIVDLKHTYIGDLVVSVQPPAGLNLQPIVLHNRAGGATRDLKRTYDASTIPALATLRGVSVRGQWTLEIRDAAAQDAGMLRQFGLEIGLASPPRDAEAPGGAATPRRARRSAAAGPR